ncbi:MAG: acyloxyacyl hydrolase [Bacteroidales bacterium]|jgi:hypothetical protein|nr:acyloxyacyl hydrolase [Bacteroidales bacterium]
MIKYFLLFSIFPFVAFAQSDKKLHKDIFTNLSIQGIYQNGYVFPTNDFVKGINGESEIINAFQTFSIKISKQTTGKSQWEQLYNYPNWGIGVSAYDFYNPEEIGTPIAFYGFFNAPFKRWNKLTFNYEFGFGATFNWKSFDPVSNKYNIAIGAGQSFLIDVGLNLQYNLTKHLGIETGFSLTHFSNGALKKPNKGINTIAPKISLKYNFDERPAFTKQEIPIYKKENEWLISVFGGVKNVIFDSVNIGIIEKYEGVNFPVFGVSTTFNRQIGYKSKIGIGMSFSYNGTVNAQVAVDDNELEAVEGPFGDKLQVSIYPSYELVIDKFSLILQPAFYIYRKTLKNQSPVFHQRIGVKYHFSNNFFAGITLRDYKFHVSDFIEWNVGYRIKWN